MLNRIGTVMVFLGDVLEDVLPRGTGGRVPFFVMKKKTGQIIAVILVILLIHNNIMIIEV